MSHAHGEPRQRDSGLSWALLGLAEPAEAGRVALALHRRGLASVPAFDAQHILLHLDSSSHHPFGVIVLDRRLPQPPPPAQLVDAVRARTEAAILTIGGEPATEELVDANLPLETPAEAVAASASIVAAHRDRVCATSWGPLRLNPNTWEAHWARTPLQLTNQQFRMLGILVAADGATVSPVQLADALYGTALLSDRERIRAHIARLRRRLGDAVPAAADLLLTVRGEGYRLAAAEPD